MNTFVPDFEVECRECGRTPTVKVLGHVCPQTELCGVHFFGDKLMLEWEEWNETPEGTE